MDLNDIKSCLAPNCKDYRLIRDDGSWRFLPDWEKSQILPVETVFESEVNRFAHHCQDVQVGFYSPEDREFQLGVVTFDLTLQNYQPTELLKIDQQILTALLLF